MSEIKLKPCPFCGCIPKIVKYIETPIHGLRERKIYFSPECVNEECVIYRRENSFSSEEEAAEAWNRRNDNA